MFVCHRQIVELECRRRGTWGPKEAVGTRPQLPGRVRAAAVSINVRVKRAYDPADRGDGYRVLIDHVWPRGVTRERARADEWVGEVAPSDAELRRWFVHDPARFEEFRTHYRDELRWQAGARRRSASERGGPLTTVYAARDREHNNAVVLAELPRDG